MSSLPMRAHWAPWPVKTNPMEGAFFLSAKLKFSVTLLNASMTPLGLLTTKPRLARRERRLASV